MPSVNSPPQLAVVPSPTVPNARSGPPPVEFRPTPVARAVVVYGSRFGNTRRLAEALARGLRRHPSLAVDCRSIDEVAAKDLAAYDLLAIGGPTEIFSAAKPMKAFLASLPDGGLAGKHGFAFETRLESRIAGSSGHFIEQRMRRLGLHIVRPYATAIVRGMTKDERRQFGDEGAPEWARKFEKAPAPGQEATDRTLDLLAPGAESEFEQIGAELAAVVVATPV
jgi:flavodoxin